MKLEGIHHITGITGNAQQNADYYAGKPGLRLVKKTVNQDDPTVYHLFYADELVVDTTDEEPLMAEHPEISREHALRGFDGVRAFAEDPERSAEFLRTLEFEPGWIARGEQRSGKYVYDAPPPDPGVP